MTSKTLIDNADHAAELLSLLSNGKRLLILDTLLDGEMSSGALGKKVGLSDSALSQHLAKLRAFGLVENRRDKNMVFYRCRSVAVQRILLALDDIFEDTAALGQALEPLRRATKTSR